MSALNRVGESTKTDYATFYCADLPGVPGTPTLISSSTSSISFKWTPPANSGGAEINGYDIFFKRSNEAESEWALLSKW